MKNIRSILIIVLVIGAVVNLSAQGRQAKTSSAKAAYGFAPERTKQKKKKRPKAKRDKTVSITRKEKKSAPKKRSNWAG